MSIVTCPECGNQISNLVNACPNCGFPICEYISFIENEKKKIPDNKKRIANTRYYGYGNNLKNIFPVVSVIIIIALLVYNFSLNSKYNGLQESYYSVISQLNEARNKQNILKRQNEKLQKEDFSEEYQSLLSKYNNLELEIEEYQDQQATINDLNSKLAELQRQYDSLQTDRDSIQQQLDAKKLAEEQAARKAQQQLIAQQESSATVYWVAGGECYHSTSSCPTLKRSNNISSGTISQSGRRPCKVCH